MATQDYYQKYMQNIVQGMMPNLNKQKSGMYDYLLQLAQRQGTGSAMQNVARGMAPYAEAAGDAAARAGVQATRMGQQQEQYESQLAQRQSEFSQGQENWQQAFDQRNTQQNFANQLALQQTHGAFTPEMLEAFGYGDVTRGGQRGVQRQLDILGINRNQQPGQQRDIYGGTSGAWNNWGGRTGLVYAR